MAFTTILKNKKEKNKEKYDFPVLTQYSYNVAIKGEKTKFELNKAAMEAFEFILNTPNTNKINWGIDDETGDLMLANTFDQISDKVSNITANNTFSCQALLDKIAEKLFIDPLMVNEFELYLHDEGDYKVASMKLIVEDSECIPSLEEPMSDTFVEQQCDTYHQKVSELF